MTTATKRVTNPAERLIFAPTIEALLTRSVREKLPPGLEDKLRGVGIDLAKPLRPAYPLPAYMSAMELVAQALYPGLPMGEAQLQMGRSTVTGWEYTLVGKAMFTVAKLYGPRRVLLRYPTMAMSSNNFLSMEARELGPTEVELRCEPFTGWPEYFQGNLQAVAALAGAKEPRVVIRKHDPARELLELSVRWTA